MKKIANGSAYFFMIAVAVLSVVSILGIWEFFQNDVIWKSFESVGLLAVVAIIVITADHYIGHKDQVDANGVVIPDTAGNTVFPAIRVATLSVLITSAGLLALIGILAIWEVVSGASLHKAIASIFILGFSALIVVVMCLEREKNPILQKKHVSGGFFVIVIIFAWIFISMMSVFMR